MTTRASQVLSDLHWTEKYRPHTLDDVALEPDTRTLLEAYLAAGEIPHLLLGGPPGSGKTTVSRILLDQLDCATLTLNASSERGIDVVREKIGTFVTAVSPFRWNVVFLDEADQMTPDAQTAMRNLIESYADQARFVLTANQVHRIIGPIQSRCQVLTFGRPPLKERYRILVRVLESEGIEFEKATALAYAEKFPDLRRLLHQAQRRYLTAGADGTLPPVTADSSEVTGVDLFKMLCDKSWTGLRRVAASGDFDVQQGLRDLFYAIPDNHARVGFLRHVIGRGVHETGFTPDPVVLFLAVTAEAMEGL